MARLHHVNLGVPPDAIEAQGRFLVDVLGYRRLESPDFGGRRPEWYEADDGTQVHLSPDPEHHPASRAHTAIEIDYAAVEVRLKESGIPYEAAQLAGVALMFCRDPAGNRWELRG